MTNVTTTHIVRIGNSRGVRIPKLWLEQLDLGGEVEMALKADQLVIRSSRRPRQSWEEQFRAMHKHGDDRLVDEFPAAVWDQCEWTW
jgi:antitoxin MazE